MRLSGNTVLITGGSSGIGYALAEAFLAAGSTVLACARSGVRLEQAQRQLPDLQVQVCDVANPGDREVLLARVHNELPALNVLINNAGIQRDVDFRHGAEALAAGDDEVRINLEAPIALTALFAPLLSRNAPAAVINLSSGLAFVPAARMPVYSATKAAIHAFSMASRRQLSSIGVAVFEVVPPAVDTALNPEGRAARGGFRPELKPRPFVEAVMEGLAADTAEIGYGMTESLLRASRDQLDAAFERMNAGS